MVIQAEGLMPGLVIGILDPDEPIAIVTSVERDEESVTVFINSPKGDDMLLLSVYDMVAVKGTSHSITPDDIIYFED